MQYCSLTAEVSFCPIFMITTMRARWQAANLTLYWYRYIGIDIISAKKKVKAQKETGASSWVTTRRKRIKRSKLVDLDFDGLRLQPLADRHLKDTVLICGCDLVRASILGQLECALDVPVRAFDHVYFCF